MQTTLAKRTIVLLGIGHTNAHVLRMWKMSPVPGAELICVSNHSRSTYSGMLPGVLAGQYSAERMEIDLVRLCAATGARLIVGEVTGLDHQRQSLTFRDRPELPFDALSIGIGSVPRLEGIELADPEPLTIKPMQTFLSRLQRRLERVTAQTTAKTIRVALIGAGAGGTEIALCLPQRLSQWYPDRTFELSLISATSQTVQGVLPRTSARVAAVLRARGVQLIAGQKAKRWSEGTLELEDGTRLDIDLPIWATSAVAPPLLRELGLPTDERGFLLTEDHLKVACELPVFAVGDSGTLRNHPTPKAGVYAVRQGPVLYRNLKRLLAGQSLEPYRPQRDFLTLLNLGDGRAVAQYKGLTFSGRWCWWLKDAIDSKFMDKYQNYEPMEMEWKPPDPETAMRCAGCGGKVGGSVLSRVLSRLQIPDSEHVLVGLDQPDDAAVIQPPAGRPLTVTTDFFTAPLNDPYIVGRIAALNAASDVFAMGARPLAALTLATIPVGSPRKQEQLLYETLAGSLHEFRRMGTTLAGGHTIEGPSLTVGYTVLADQGERPVWAKGQLRPGDQLILTKPLGSGILLAAHMQARCRSEWMETLLETMLLSNEHAAELMHRFPLPGVTDVTGFGLAGHLLEMLKPNRATARLNLAAIPLLPGTASLFADGIESTLAPANRDAETAIEVTESLRQRAEFAALFDPQTCGGLLLGVPPEDVDAVLAQLAHQSDVPASVIGEVIQHDGQGPRIELHDAG